jgi:hypothetical protein
MCVEAVPKLKQLVAGFQPRRPGFKPGSSHVVFVVDKVALSTIIIWGWYNRPVK